MSDKRRKILEKAFKETYKGGLGEAPEKMYWDIELRDFEHGFSNWYHAVMLALEIALKGEPNGQGN